MSVPNILVEHINLITLNYNQLAVYRGNDFETIINADTFDIKSTNASNSNDHYFYSNHRIMHTLVTKKRARSVKQLYQVPTLQHIERLVFYFTYPKPTILAFLEDVFIWVKQSKVTSSFFK